MQWPPCPSPGSPHGGLAGGEGEEEQPRHRLPRNPLQRLLGPRALRGLTEAGRAGQPRGSVEGHGGSDVQSSDEPLNTVPEGNCVPGEDLGVWGGRAPAWPCLRLPSCTGPGTPSGVAAMARDPFLTPLLLKEPWPFSPATWAAESPARVSCSPCSWSARQLQKQKWELSGGASGRAAPTWADAPLGWEVHARREPPPHGGRRTEPGAATQLASPKLWTLPEVTKQNLELFFKPVLTGSYHNQMQILLEGIAKQGRGGWPEKL